MIEERTYGRAKMTMNDLMGGEGIASSASITLDLAEHIRDLQAQLAQSEARAAGLVPNANRYEFLKARFTGYDFNWMPSEQGLMDGKVCVVFEVSQDHRGGRDIDEAIDTYISDTAMRHE
jgi:hypothetical protein